VANPQQPEANRPEPSKVRPPVFVDGALRPRKSQSVKAWEARLLRAGRDGPKPRPNDSWTFFRYWRADPKDPNGVAAVVYLDERGSPVAWKEFVPYQSGGFLPPVPE